MPFQPGQSGNPKGRPPGTRNRRTIAAEKMFDEDAEKITETLIRLAKEGHPVALRLCMERICAPSKDRPTPIDLPQIGAASDAVGAMSKLVQSVADGDLSAAEVAELAKVVHGFSQTVSNADLEQRITRLEQKAIKMEKEKKK